MEILNGSPGGCQAPTARFGKSFLKMIELVAKFFLRKPVASATETVASATLPGVTCRNVLLTEAAIEVLKCRLAKGKGPFLFPSRRDPDNHLTTVHKAHLAALEAAGINPPFRLYDLRHTYGSRSAMAGVDLPTLKELMGHSSIATTMRYVHPTPEHKRQAVQKLETFNAEQVFAVYEARQGSPQKSPQ